jgi:uncharacterized protein YecT (DUF1311 family)
LRPVRIAAAVRVFCSGLIALSAAVAEPARKQDNAVDICFNKHSNAEQRECMIAVYNAARIELDDVLNRRIDGLYRLALPRQDADEIAAAMRKSQAAWEAYRNAECGEVVGQGRDGSGRRTFMMACYADKTIERIKEVETSYEQRR